MAVETATGATRERPIGVTILAGLAAIALVLSVLHLLQAVGLLSYFIGPIAIRDFNIWYALMWGLMIWAWAWAFRALLDMDPAAWLFLVIVSGLNLLFAFITIIGAPSPTTDVAGSFLLNLVVFGYAMTPSTKRAFGTE
jgi:hypothetical protein